MATDSQPGHTAQAASKIAQLLGEVIIHHAPVTAELAESAKARFREALLEELEQHTANISGPLIETLLSTDAIPPEIATMLRSISDPEHQVSAIAGQFLVYGVGFAVASQVLQPFLQEAANVLWADNTYKPIDPANLVAMAVRGIDPGSTDVTPISGDIFKIAAESGYSNQNFQAMVDAAGQPPSPQDLFQMWRRKIIDTQGLIDGLRQGDTKNSWIPQFQQLAYTTPTPIDMVRAAVQNQLTYDEANSIAIELGLEPPGFIDNNPDWFKVLFDIAGRPPGPQEVGRMANRGIVPWAGTGAGVASFEQAIAESDIKTYWTPYLQALEAYYPGPDEAKALYDAGALTIEQATEYWHGAGLPAELIAAFTHQATIQQVTQERALAKGSVLTGLYDGIFTEAQATDLLGDLGYTGKVAADLIDLTMYRREIRAIDMAVRKIGTLYVAYKLTNTDAMHSLSALGISDAQATNLIDIWSIERAPEYRLPTISELGNAVRYAGLPYDVAVTKAMRLGYTKYDATLIIASVVHAAPPDGFPPDDDTGVDV